MLYVIPGNPVPLARARFSKHKKVYDSQKSQKMFDGITLQGQHQGEVLIGPLHLDIKFFMPIPSSASKRKREELGGQCHVSRPDTDNMIKYYLDIAVEAGLLIDDCLVSVITARKIYGKEPRTEFTLSVIK